MRGERSLDLLDPDLLPFQKRFIKALESGRYDECVLSLPRGGGKSALSAHLLVRCLTPGDRLNVPGAEYIMCAASLQQARIVFRFVRAALDRPPFKERYSWLDSAQQIGVRDVVTNTRIRALASGGRTAMGLVGVPLVVADEPGAWEVGGGELMRAALTTAIGKPGSNLRVVYVGTIAPATPQSWWARLVKAGTQGRTYVELFQGDGEKWNDWREVKRANPLVGVDPATEIRLRDEIARAELDDHERAGFVAYRLNNPSMGGAASVCTVTEWEIVKKRRLAPCGDHPPVVGIDLGAGKSWSSAVAMWPSGRMECIAQAPGIPDLGAQEKRDRQPRGLYGRLHADGSLLVDEGVRMQRCAQLVEEAFARWGDLGVIVCDRFRMPELVDAVDARCPVMPRAQRWSEASEDITAFRRFIRDGPLSLPRVDEELMFASLAQATVESDGKGLYKVVKDANGSARDDVVCAAVLACGVMSRSEYELGWDFEADGDDSDWKKHEGGPAGWSGGGFKFA